MIKNDLSAKKRMRFGLFLYVIACIVVIIRLVFLQIIDRSELKAKAENQQSSSRAVGAARGTIYDCSRRDSFGS